MFGMIRKAGAAVSRARMRSTTRRAISHLDARMLRDIGVEDAFTLGNIPRPF